MEIRETHLRYKIDGSFLGGLKVNIGNKGLNNEVNSASERASERFTLWMAGKSEETERTKQIQGNDLVIDNKRNIWELPAITLATVHLRRRNGKKI